MDQISANHHRGPPYTQYYSSASERAKKKNELTFCPWRGKKERTDNSEQSGGRKGIMEIGEGKNGEEQDWTVSEESEFKIVVFSCKEWEPRDARK